MRSKLSSMSYQNQIRLLLGVLLLILVGLGLLSSRSIKFNNDISVMLPQQAELLQTFDFFRESPVGKNVFLSLRIHEQQDLKEFLSILDSFLKNLDIPLIKRVVKSLDVKDQLGSLQDYVRLAPQIMQDRDLQQIKTQLNDDFVQQAMKKNYHRLLSPTGFSASPFMEIDPFGFQTAALEKLKKMMPFRNMDLEMVNGYIVGAEKRNVLVVLETDVSTTEGDRSKIMIQSLTEKLKQLSAYASVDIVSSHLHALSNEKVIKKDIFITVSAASMGFLLLFLILFKDLRSVILFIIPVISVCLALPICAWVMGDISFIILGMAAVISGIAVDYCIHVYVALKSAQDHKGALREVTPPILLGALTTMGVFSVFLLSEVPGYRQLSLLTLLSLMISLGLAIFFLPHFLSVQANKNSEAVAKHFALKIPDRIAVGLWAVLMLVFLITLPFVKMKTDVKQYDGSEASIFKTEDEFSKNWGVQDQPAMLVVEAPNAEAAIERNDEILSMFADRSMFQSLSAVLPPEWVRLENSARWNRFWKEGNTEKVREMIDKTVAKYDFSPNAFEPFMQSLYLGPEDIKAYENLDILKTLKERFMFSSKNKIKILNYFPDEQAQVIKVSALIKNEADAFVVSNKTFTQLLSTKILAEAKFLALLIAVIIPLLTFLFLKNLRLTFIALIPVLSSILSIFGVLTLLGLNLNAANVIALLVVGGLSIDYGIFMIYQSDRQLKGDTQMAVTLSALTTLFGAGALVLAKHPVLFSYGLTMLIGISAGYFSAIFVVPAFYHLTHKEKSKGV
jgi:predicted exporter